MKSLKIQSACHKQHSASALHRAKLNVVLGIMDCLFLELYVTRKYSIIRVQTEEYCNFQTGGTRGQTFLQAAWLIRRHSKVKLSLCLLKHKHRHMGDGGIAPRILKPRTRHMWEISFKIRPLYPWGKGSRYRINWRLCSCRKSKSDFSVIYLVARLLHWQNCPGSCRDKWRLPPQRHNNP
jgi:hypothetical protein